MRFHVAQIDFEDDLNHRDRALYTSQYASQGTILPHVVTQEMGGGGTVVFCSNRVMIHFVSYEGRTGYNGMRESKHVESERAKEQKSNDESK